VDIAGDADATRYLTAFEALLEDQENDAILVMNVPTALASADAAARSIAACAQTHRNSFIRPKPVFAVWVGSSEATTPIFEAAGIPSYATESDAVRGFMHLVHYREALDALMATPPSLAQDFKPDVAAARGIVENAVRRGSTWLDPIESTHLVAAYSIPIAPARLAHNADEAAAAARPFLAEGSGVVTKILSPDIVQNPKSAASDSISPASALCATRSWIFLPERGPRGPTPASPAWPAIHEPCVLPPPRGRELRARRVRHPRAVRPQRVRSRLHAHADDHRICPCRRPQDHRGPGAG